ncbi:hypothetical protein [Gandjariella thermophila]|uniref:hypothetical protein n=1 Tax=Gandjariella thermophila TaxID=1931992 RepID=UPI0010F7C9A3|nr:hypothetical protein [Gandjariella thermophila]
MATTSFTVGDVVETSFRPDRPIKVTAVMYEAVVRLRSALIVAAQRRSTLTYEEASAAIDCAFVPAGLGRPLDLLAEDCVRRGEPSLAALIVQKRSGEVGSAFIGNADAERERCYRHWR